MNIENLRSEHTLNNKTRRLFESCEVNPDDVDPKVLGRGGNHKVYRFKDGEKVVKVPINQLIGTVASGSEEKENIELYQEYFPDFSVPTSFRESSLGYCAVMDFVDGRLMTSEDVYESKSGELKPTGEQLERIIFDNQKLMQDKGKMMDLVGLEGLIGGVRGLHPNAKPVELTNVRISDSGLKIVDYDLVSLKDHKRPLSKVQAVFAYQLNQQVLSRHFKLDYGGKEGRSL